MFKIVNNETPGYLKNLLPNRVRNNQNYEVPYSRLCSYENAYFSSTLRLWNDLDQDTRNLSSVLEFKNRIKVRLPIHQQTTRYQEKELTIYIFNPNKT